MGNEDLIGINPQQWREISGVVLDARTTRLPYVGVEKKHNKTGYDALRVMILGPDYPIYSPRTTRQVAYFARDLTRETITIEMFGDDLAGFIDLWIDGQVYHTNCQLGTEELREWLGFDLSYCRVTAFPGLWEFAFRELAPEMSAEPGQGNGADGVSFRGGLVVTLEGWVSVDKGDGTLDLLDVVDAIPFAEGEVKPGAIAIARYSSSVGWLVEKWQCREFRFYPG
jgi:hypothetical protein